MPFVKSLADGLRSLGQVTQHRRYYWSDGGDDTKKAKAVDLSKAP